MNKTNPSIVAPPTDTTFGPNKRTPPNQNNSPTPHSPPPGKKANYAVSLNPPSLLGLTTSLPHTMSRLVSKTYHFIHLIRPSHRKRDIVSYTFFEGSICGYFSFSSSIYLSNLMNSFCFHLYFCMK